MIKILFFIEELVGGGAEKVLQNLANNMDQSQFDITVQSVWPYQGEKILAPGIRYKSLYPVKNRITEHIYRLEAAAGLAYRLHMKDNYDIEVAFLPQTKRQESMPGSTVIYPAHWPAMFTTVMRLLRQRHTSGTKNMTVSYAYPKQ